MNWIDAPTTIWGTAGFGVALAIASVILAFLVVFSGRLVLAPARLYWEQHVRADALREELKIVIGAPNEGPNWPIRELFFYLEPEALDRPHDNLWQKAGDQIRDALSLGRLRIWGRPTKTKLGDWIGERAALRPIENTYWERAFFTYTFFDASARSDTDCYADRNTGRPAYGDLQVNRAEVLKVWPGDPDDLAENYPNVCVADSPSIIDLFGGSERTKLVALLASGSLRSWARPSADHTRGDPDFVKLEGTIWNTHKFRFDPKREGHGAINQTFLTPKNSPNSSYYDVCLNYAQLRSAWPDLSIHRTKCDSR